MACLLLVSFPFVLLPMCLIISVDSRLPYCTGSGRGGIESAWNRVVAALGLHGRRLVLRAGCPNIDEIESALNLALPADYKEWLALHDGEEFTHGRVDYLPTAETRLLPADVTVARWIDNEWFASDDELNLSSDQDDNASTMWSITPAE